jgi:Fe-S cluster assembly ATP-binding protein
LSRGVKLRRPDNAPLVITHYQRLPDDIVTDFVHVLAEGRIVRTGDKRLALELEDKGYDWLLKEPAAASLRPRPTGSLGPGGGI